MAEVGADFFHDMACGLARDFDAAWLTSAVRLSTFRLLISTCRSDR